MHYNNPSCFCCSGVRRTRSMEVVPLRAFRNMPLRLRLRHPDVHRLPSARCTARHGVGSHAEPPPSPLVNLGAARDYCFKILGTRLAGTET
jgi:hypothetical protein